MRHRTFCHTCSQGLITVEVNVHFCVGIDFPGLRFATLTFNLFRGLPVSTRGLCRLREALALRVTA
jgi:hypothetical protein